MNDITRLFAVIPAAGLSRRMGRPKLLLKLAGTTIIDRLLQSLDHPLIVSRHVVVRPADLALQSEVTRAGGTVVIPAADPQDMRASVALALDAIEQAFSPRDNEGWLLVPADHPVLDRELIASLVECWHTTHPRILVPRYKHRRGHPTLLGWSLAREVARIPADRGLNWLLREYADDVAEFPVDSDAAITDLDTPEDYEQLRMKWEAASGGD